MNARLDIDWVRAHAEGRLSPGERAIFEARVRSEPELAELVDQYAEVAAWPSEPVMPSASRFEALVLDDALPAPVVRRSGWLPRLAIAAGVLTAIGVGLFALGRRDPTSPYGSLVLSAIREDSIDIRGFPISRPIPSLAEGYLPVVESKLRFVEEFEAARDFARAAGRPLLVFVHLEGCPACVALERSTFADERVLAAATGYVLAKVSATVVDNRIEIPCCLGLENLRVWPLFAVFDGRGVRVDAFGGSPDAVELSTRLARAAGSPGASPVEWAVIHEASKRIRLSDAATTDGQKYAELSRIDVRRLPAALLDVIALRKGDIEGEAGATLARASTLASESGLDAAVAELDRAVERFAGSPFEIDFRRVRDHAAAYRVFPPLSYAR